MYLTLVELKTGVVRNTKLKCGLARAKPIKKNKLFEKCIIQILNRYSYAINLRSVSLYLQSGSLSKPNLEINGLQPVIYK